MRVTPRLSMLARCGGESRQPEKSLGERVVTRRNVLEPPRSRRGPHCGSVLERPPDVVIHLVLRRHGVRLLAGEPHQFGIDDNRAETIVAAIAGDHRLRGGGIERRVRLGEVLIECRLA